MTSRQESWYSREIWRSIIDAGFDMVENEGILSLPHSGAVPMEGGNFILVLGCVRIFFEWFGMCVGICKSVFKRGCIFEVLFMGCKPEIFQSSWSQLADRDRVHVFFNSFR